MITGHENIFPFLDRIIRKASVDQAEALLLRTDTGLTRFCKNSIHQNTVTTAHRLHIRVVINRKIGSFSTDRLDDAGIAHAVTSAVAIANTQEPDPEFTSLPSGNTIVETRSYVPATARSTAAERAGLVKQMCGFAEKNKANLAGAISTTNEELAIVNSLGIHAYQQSSLAEASIVASKDELSGYAYWVGADISALHASLLAEQALSKATSSLPAIALEAKPYAVVLEPYAVGILVNFLSYVGFGAKAFQEKRSFMSQKIGMRVADTRITIWDDGLEPRGLLRAFDFEGVRKRKVVLIDQGVARGVVYDSRTAARQKGTENTGHALPAPNAFGPLPINLFMQGGGALSIDDMIRDTEYGLYVTRFHYANIVEPLATVLTGMTRDGTFLIENGRLTHPVRNLRFTQSILEALQHVEALTTDTVLVQGWYGGTRVPALKIADFNFSGVSDLAGS
jgi:PmbA protein